MKKVRTFLVNSSSSLFSCSISVIYNRVNSDQKQHLMLKSYLPDINTSIFEIEITTIYF